MGCLQERINMDVVCIKDLLEGGLGWNVLGNKALYGDQRVKIACDIDIKARFYKKMLGKTVKNQRFINPYSLRRKTIPSA